MDRDLLHRAMERVRSWANKKRPAMQSNPVLGPPARKLRETWKTVQEKEPIDMGEIDEPKDNPQKWIDDLEYQREHNKIIELRKRLRKSGLGQ